MPVLLTSSTMPTCFYPPSLPCRMKRVLSTSASSSSISITHSIVRSGMVFDGTPWPSNSVLVMMIPLLVFVHFVCIDALGFVHFVFVCPYFCFQFLLEVVFVRDCFRFSLPSVFLSFCLFMLLSCINLQIFKICLLNSFPVMAVI
jgi:hypothetical protein